MSIGRRRSRQSDVVVDRNDGFLQGGLDTSHCLAHDVRLNGQIVVRFVVGSDDDGILFVGRFFAVVIRFVRSDDDVLFFFAIRLRRSVLLVSNRDRSEGLLSFFFAFGHGFGRRVGRSDLLRRSDNVRFGLGIVLLRRITTTLSAATEPLIPFAPKSSMSTILACLVRAP